jgi:hypothetical protein
VLAGTGFFTVEVLTCRGLVTYYVLFFLHLETRRLSLAGITRHPAEEWMIQMARNAVDQESGYLRRPRPRHKVLRRVPKDLSNRRCEGSGLVTSKPAIEGHFKTDPWAGTRLCFTSPVAVAATPVLS